MQRHHRIDARRGRRLQLDVGAQQRPAAAKHLRDGAAAIAAADAIDASQRADDAGAFGGGVRGGDARDDGADRDEHERKVGESGDAAAQQLLNGTTMRRVRGRRQQGGC